AVGRGAGGARGALAGLDPVAGVAVAAGSAIRERRVLTAERGVAGVRRAGVRVVAVRRDARGAEAALARLEAVAGVGVAARRAVRERAVLAAAGRVAAVGGARGQVVAVEGRAGGARAVLAR